MSFDENKLSYYIFKDLRAAQNNNMIEGNDVLRFNSLQDAISEFQRLPKEWTTALGIHTSPGSELDLVQRREGKPTLVGDYQRIPEFYYNPDVQATVRTLVNELHIQWQSDYRIFGSAPVLIPPTLDQNCVRDRFLNGKHLCPDDSRHLITAIQELYVPEEGWQPLADVYDTAKKFGYDDPHKPKITTIHVRYADEKGQLKTGDMNPYNFILLQERTKIMQHDPAAITSLAKAIEEYISRKVPEYYTETFGSADRNQKVSPGSFTRIKDVNAEHIADLIKKQDLEPLVAPVVTAIEQGLSEPIEQAEARELLGRILNIPETGDKKLSIDMRMRAGVAMEDFYRHDLVPDQITAQVKAAAQEEERS